MTQRTQAGVVVIAITVFLGIGLSRLAPAQAPARSDPPTAARRPTSEPSIATVGGVGISRADFEKRARDGEELYQIRSRAPIPLELRATFRRQILETMIREQLILHETRRRGLVLTAEQAEEQLRKDPFFNRNGIFDEARFLAVKSTQPEQFRQALAQIQRNHGALKVKSDIERENTPDPVVLRGRLERELGRARIEFLALPRGASADPDAEPSEREVIEYHRAHRDDYRRPAEARLKILIVNQPPLAPRADEAAVQSWETRMKQRADSLIAAARRGATLSPTSALGEWRDLTVSPGQFPTYWAASTRDLALRTPAGGTLPEPVRGEGAWMVVTVVEQRPARAATLGETSEPIRSLLRERAAARLEQAELGEIYTTLRDSLRGPAYRVRYAFADTARIAVPEPSAADLDRYYRGHQADYTHFDRASSSLHARPLAEVRDEVRTRWLRERRQSAARAAVDQLLEVWKQGRRDARAEKAMTGVRDVGPVPVGAAVDSSAAGRALTDSLADFTGPAIGVVRYPQGWLVYHVTGEVKDHVPTLDQCRGLLVERRAARRATAEELAARRLFDRSQEQFRTGNIVRFSRLMVEPPEVRQVSLTREEVETWYQTHIGDYGAPELSRVRHILVRPRDGSAAADADARAKAEAILARARAGEGFSSLAAELSDDEATRETGGDVGVFRRGMMLGAFEQVAFTMSPGDIRGPVKTEVGYHVMECLEYVPAEMAPLKYAYANVAADAAREKARRIARFRADSLFRILRSPTAARAAAHRLDYIVYQNDHLVGDRAYLGELAEYFLGVEKLRPRQFHPKVQEYKGMGFAVSWCDTVLPPRAATWEEARERAIEAHRVEAARLALVARKAELDSMARAGWSPDSLASLLGGFRAQTLTGVGTGLGALGGAALLDSLVSGAPGHAPALSPGQTSDWVEFPGGLARIRMVERNAPDPIALASRVESQQRLELEKNLRTTFDKLKERYPVRILDRDLAITELPALTATES